MHLLRVGVPWLLASLLAAAAAEDAQQDVGTCGAEGCRADGGSGGGGGGGGGGQGPESPLGPDALRSLQESTGLDMDSLRQALGGVDLGKVLAMAKELQAGSIRETVEGASDPQAQRRLQDLAEAYGAEDFWAMGKGMCGTCVDEADRAAIFAANGEAAWTGSRQGQTSHIYGEVDPKGMAYLLKHLDVKPGLVYYDLGSGSGKTPAIASYVFGMRSVGIELSTDRHRAACDAQVRWQRSQNGLGGSSLFVKGSFFDYDISDADVVYMNNMEFTAEMMDRLGEVVRATRPGTKILSMDGGPKLPAWITSATDFKYLGAVETTASWGSASLHIHEKLTEPPVGHKALSPPGKSSDLCGTSPFSGAVPRSTGYLLGFASLLISSSL